MEKKVVFIGADHAGYTLKEKAKAWLRDWGYEYVDNGAFAMEPDDDYPDMISAVARNVSQNRGGRGIVIGHSGQGEAIAANKIPGVRAVVYYGGPPEIPTLSRRHNDANVLSLGAAFLDDATAMAAVKLWLETSFSGKPRHRRRISKIGKLERNN